VMEGTEERVPESSYPREEVENRDMHEMMSLELAKQPREGPQREAELSRKVKALQATGKGRQAEVRPVVFRRVTYICKKEVCIA
jgi:hypothetical protein